MKTKNLGNSGLKVSELCLGCMNFGDSTSESESIKIIEKAYENGIYFLDTADRYSGGISEEIVGKAQKIIGQRDKLVIATKVRGQTGDGPNDKGLSRRHIIMAVEDSLRRLKTDYIDLYQMHRPDEDTPVDEILEAFDRLSREGKVLYYGTSTFASWQMAEMELIAKSKNWIGPICEQAPYNILDRRIENDRAGFIGKYQWGLLTWSPLAGGQLTGKYKAAEIEKLPKDSRVQRNTHYQARTNSESIKVSEMFVELCCKMGYKPTEAAIAWILNNPLVTSPIIGPRNVEHLDTILPSVNIKLSSDFFKEIDKLVQPGNAVADFLAPNVNWQKGKIKGIN